MMTKNELKKQIISSELSLFCILGTNTTGKTFFLNKLFDSLENALFFREDGVVTVSDNRKKISIVGNKYFYIDNSERGRKIAGHNQDYINKESQNIIDYVEKMKNRIDTRHLSLGSEKLIHILNAFTSFNMNNIKYFLVFTLLYFWPVKPLQAGLFL